MKHISDEKQLLSQILNMLSNHLGDSSEIVLHDLTQGYEHTIVDIRNGALTGRTIGDCGSNAGLEVLRGTVKDGDRYNYVTQTPDGKILRTSSLYIRDDTGAVIGSICVNTDITETVRFEEYLHRHNQYELPQEGDEIFARDVGQLLDYLIQQAQLRCGKVPEAMTKKDKLEFIRFLDEKGAFLISKAGPRICDTLKISKFTLYSYLDSVRAAKSQPESDTP